MKKEEKDTNKRTFKETLKIVERATEVEKELKEDYIAEFIEDGFDPREAKKIVKILLKKALEGFLKKYTGEMKGDRLLETERKDEKVKTRLDYLRKQGVTDDDIREWWNMHDLERKMIELSELYLRNASYHGKIRLGKTKEEALTSIKKGFVCYFHSTTLHSVDNDEPIIPIELKGRINDYLKKRDEEDPDQYLKDLEEMGTLTALVRKEIANGNI